MSYQFPEGFTWGTATAAYQVEGAIREDDRVPSIWDTYCAVPGNIMDASSGEFACDQYHRWPQDVALMKELGVGAYRMSIAWSRIIPSCGGSVNQAGINHYLGVLDALCENGIKPVVTLYHWDLPQYLEDLGGWPNRDIAQRFAEYAGVLAKAFGNRVDTWTTLNEPWCTAYLGYGNGAHAPGIKDHALALRTVHHLNLAHGLGIQAIRAELGQQAKCSVTLNLQVNRAASDSPEDLEAKSVADRMGNEVFLGPMMEGRYDTQIFEDTRSVTDWAFVHDGDERMAHQPLQSLGINYYSTAYVRRSHDEVSFDTRVLGEGTHANAMPAQEHVEVLPPEGELTDMGWNQEPQGLTDVLCEMSQRFPGVELVVTENGSAWKDSVTEDADVLGVFGSQTAEGSQVKYAVVPGKIVHDGNRVAYLDAHVKAVADAIERGANVTGYYAWSLLDNFEWARGYTKRFGIIRVDYDTQERIWKDSARLFQQIAKSNSID